ncbi:MAG: hypothetical protein J6Y14_00265 [Fibrobacter sp.]|nr:hypothetical protein [Fibrobacter sp.]
MDQVKKEQLEKKGWKVGNVDEYLDLTPVEMAIVEKQSIFTLALQCHRDLQD